jgi:AhpD family alkylhydroperoxidase
VRQKLQLSGALRELIIMRVAALNGAPYEAGQHAPIALKEGVSRPSWTRWNSGRRAGSSVPPNAPCCA